MKSSSEVRVKKEAGKVYKVYTLPFVSRIMHDCL